MYSFVIFYLKIKKNQNLNPLIQNHHYSKILITFFSELFFTFSLNHFYNHYLNFYDIFFSILPNLPILYQELIIIQAIIIKNIYSWIRYYHSFRQQLLSFLFPLLEFIIDHFLIVFFFISLFPSKRTYTC